jgi:hypothetical protein
MGVGDHTNRHVIRIDSLVGVWCGTGIMGDLYNLYKLGRATGKLANHMEYGPAPRIR